VNVVRDLLDKLLVDRNGREMGRVDGIVLDLRQGEPPRLASFVVGPTALGSRLHPVLGRWVHALEEALGIAGGRPVYIDCTHVTEIDMLVKLDLAISETAVDVVEGALRRWLKRIPGAQ
jgi:sporulation protein YlmC with PRC-barrel domain